MEIERLQHQIPRPLVAALRLAFACYAYTFASLQECLALDSAFAASAVAAFASALVAVVAMPEPCAAGGLN